MANWISNSRNAQSVDVDMSNGATDVIIASLCLAGADIAVTNWQKRSLQWIAAHDQSIMGRGCVSFDVADLGWTTIDFDAQHRFMLQVVDRALMHHAWDKLPYSPNAEIVDDMLTRIRKLFCEFTIKNCTNDALEWPLAPPTSIDRCAAHGVFMHAHGCPLCNESQARCGDHPE
ncbi:MAG: hypothetical protein KDB14_07460 [Planctomycetales bacterium]|nr:hypothetical protein [Planctomycetales bacterium]